MRAADWFFRTRYILGFTSQQHTIRELPSVAPPPKGILINQYNIQREAGWVLPGIAARILKNHSR